ncbi:MAG: hypothetical protein KIH71_004020 [Roseobacter sp.]|nr:hypothetical protein [Roseobacter sp.]
MDFIEKNKKLIVPVVAGALLAVVLNWADLPAWLIGAAVAAVVSLWSGKLVEVYDSKIAPKINPQREDF